MTYLERHDDEENLHRYYAVEVTRDLFGNWVVTRNWGRIGSPRGRGQQSAVETKTDAKALVEKFCHAKLKRGYGTVV